MPPRGRMPRTSGTPRVCVTFSSGPRQPSRKPTKECPYWLHALAHHRADDRVQSGAVAPAGEYSDAHPQPPREPSRRVGLNLSVPLRNVRDTGRTGDR